MPYFTYISPPPINQKQKYIHKNGENTLLNKIFRISHFVTCQDFWLQFFCINFYAGGNTENWMYHYNHTRQRYIRTELIFHLCNIIVAKRHTHVIFTYNVKRVVNVHYEYENQ